MKQEFVTLYGKAIIERNVLFLRSPYLPFDKTAFVEIAFAFLWIAVFILQFFSDEGPRRYLGIVMWGILLITRLPYIYNTLFKKSYANRISLSAIRSIKTEEDHHGLQVTVTLYLKSGRFKRIIFRKLENQHDNFIQALSSELSISGQVSM